MLVKILLCSAIICLAEADVNHLANKYLPPVPPTDVKKNSEVIYTSSAAQQTVNNLNVPESHKANDVPDFTNNQAVESDTHSNAVAKEAAKDPIYGGIPFGGFPGAFPNPGFSGQIYPRPVFPSQGLPGQGLSSFPSSAGFIPLQIAPGQGFPGQVFPGQGFPGQGFPMQVFPGQGFPGLGFPGQGFASPAFPGAIPNYPVYFSNSQHFQAEEKEDNTDNKLRVSVVESDAQDDNGSSGYLYTKPSDPF